MSSSKDKLLSNFYFMGVRKIILIIAIGLILSAILGSQIPQIMLSLGKNYSDKELFHSSLWKLGIIFFLTYLNRVIYQLSINKYVKLIVFELRSKCYSKWLKYDPAHKGAHEQEDRYPQGEVIARIMSDTEAIRELITSGTFGVLIDMFFVISCLISFISINTTSGVVLVITEVIACAVLVWGSRYMRKVFLAVRKARGDLYKTVANVVGGFEEIYYTRHDQYASKKGEKIFSEFLNRQLISNFYDASYYSVAESLFPLLLALVVLIFPYSNITEGAVILAVVDLIQRSIGPVKDISSKIANLQRAYTGFIRIDQFSEDLSKGIREYSGQLGNMIDFDEYSLNINEFYYEGSKERFKIQDVRIDARKGDLIGMVGPSGCGKSTVLKIMAAQVLPMKFNLNLNRNEQKLLHLDENQQTDFIKYREQVGIVSQESHIFSESLKFNITMGQKDSDEKFLDFWNFAKKSLEYLSFWGVEAEDIITPQDLSLGQKQLIAALRSCYLRKSIVLFDEISSALDTRLEESLRKVIGIIQQSSLTFIVAHRLETVIGASSIYVMKDGSVVSKGEHHELVKSCEVYQDFIAEISK